MTKRRTPPPQDSAVNHNPVAKFAHQFNKAQVFRDKRAYRRSAKHRGQEPFALNSTEFNAQGFCPRHGQGLSFSILRAL